MKKILTIALAVVACAVLTLGRTYPVYATENKPKLPAELISAIKCESGFQQFKNGKPNVHENTKNGKVTSRDWGAAMINDVWEPTAKKMKLDYKNSLADNLKMALHVYKVQGIGAWYAYDAKTGKCVWELQYKK